MKHVLIDSFAGSGKTRKLVELIRTTYNKHTLLLTFNKSLQTENSYLEKEYGITVKTFHSLAWNEVKKREGYFTASSTLNYSILKKNINITDATTLDNVFNQFCNSNLTKDDFIKTVLLNKESMCMYSSETIKEFSTLITYIEEKKIYTHTYYLKKYQLMKIKLKNYNNILVDEFHDLSDCMIDIINNQKDICNIVVSMDQEQRIYTWRGASGQIPIVFDETIVLDKTYRCPQEIIDIANPYLNYTCNRKMGTYNKNVGEIIENNITFDKNTYKLKLNGYKLPNEDQTVISMHNYSLIAMGIKFSKKFNIDYKLSFSFDELESHYLFSIGKSTKNSFLNNFKNGVTGLSKYYASARLMDKHNILNIVSNITNWGDFKNAVLHHSDSKPTLTLLTVFTAKGLEWNNVVLIDFINIHEVEDITITDIRCMYVGITRAKKKLTLPSHMVHTTDSILETLKNITVVHTDSLNSIELIRMGNNRE